MVEFCFGLCVLFFSTTLRSRLILVSRPLVIALSFIGVGPTLYTGQQGFIGVFFDSSRNRLTRPNVWCVVCVLSIVSEPKAFGYHLKDDETPIAVLLFALSALIRVSPIGFGFRL